ncbi:MAG: RNA-guided endonuclease InsQ/TnpB family protein [Candidatus Izemoplasmataceae bacterium]
MKRTITRGERIRIYPTEEQANKMNMIIGCVRLVWNYSLMERSSIYELYKDYPELLASHTFKSQKDWKIFFPFLKEADSQALNTEQQLLNQAFKYFYKGTHKYPKFKSKKHFRNSYTTHTTNNNIKIEENFIKIPKVGWVKLKSTRRDLPIDANIKAVTISRTKTNKYYVSLRLSYEQEVVEHNMDVLKAIGLDFSMSDFYVDHNGKKANYPMYLYQSLEKLGKLQRQLSHKVKGSRNYEKQKLKIAKLYEKITNQRNDFLHKLSRTLVNNYDIITVETLDLDDMRKKAYYSKQISDMSYHRFISYLKYKCDDMGKMLHQVSKYYPSSKTCSVCGKIKKALALSTRTYTCECGNVIDRDINAAINLGIQGMKTYLTNLLEDRTASIAW